MEKLKKEKLEAWIKKQNWLQIGEQPTATGRQLIYITPFGQDVVIVYDLEGNLYGIGHIPQTPQVMQGPGAPGFPGGLSIGRG